MPQPVRPPTYHAPPLPGLDSTEQLPLVPSPQDQSATEDQDAPVTVCEGQTTVYDMLSEVPR